MDEFSLIKKYFADLNSTPIDGSVKLGIGDDAAIIRPANGEDLLITTDTLINAVHFPDKTPPRAIAYKSLAVNLSDIAAMAGTARWFTLALSLPEPDQNWLKEFSAGLFELANMFHVQLVGGDTTRGPLSITISVIGTVSKGGSVRRSTAQVGDRIFITGEPGLAKLGLSTVNKEIELPEKEKMRCLDKLNYPQPRLQEGVFLRDYASSMIDVSDGLAADLAHIADASACSAVLLAQALAEFNPESHSLTANMAIDAVLYGGDDYELLFTVPTDKCEEMEQAWSAAFSNLSCIGEITAGKGVFLQERAGELRKITAAGYNHFHV